MVLLPRGARTSRLGVGRDVAEMMAAAFRPHPTPSDRRAVRLPARTAGRERPRGEGRMAMHIAILPDPDRGMPRWGSLVSSILGDPRLIYGAGSGGRPGHSTARRGERSEPDLLDDLPLVNPCGWGRNRVRVSLIGTELQQIEWRDVRRRNRSPGQRKCGSRLRDGFIGLVLPHSRRHNVPGVVRRPPRPRRSGRPRHHVGGLGRHVRPHRPRRTGWALSIGRP